MSRFEGKLIVEYWGVWRVLRSSLRYVDDEIARYCILVPEGFITDFASIPRALWNIMPPDDEHYREAAVVHDRLYETHELPKDESDQVLYRAMAVRGTPDWKRKTIYDAVKEFGGSAYDSGPDRQAQRLEAYKHYVESTVP